MLISFLFVFLSVYGLGLLCPVARAGLGVRLTFGWSLLVVLLVVGAALLGFPLRAWSFAVAGLGLAGLVLIRKQSPLTRDLKNPAVALAGLALIAIAVGPGTYQPVAWDELSHWIYLPRQSVVADRVFGPDLVNSIPGYPLGWPLLMAYPQALFPEFDEGRAWPAIVVLHIAALALIADFARHLAANRGMDERTAAIAAWGSIAFLLAAEAMWMLFPTLLLIEKPQIYSYVATLILAVWAAEAEAESIARWGIVAGMAFAAAYLLKVAAVTMIPALLLLPLALFLRRRPKDALVLAATLFPPMLVLMAWWRMTVPSGICTGSPQDIALGFLSRREEAWGVAAGWLSTLAGYSAAYKPAVSLAALLGFGLACVGRRRIEVMPVVVFFAFALVYLAALIATHVGCLSGYENETFMSHDRFMRVILRVLHALGLLFLFLAAGDWVRRRNWIDPRSRLAGAALAAVAGAFLIWQGVKSHAALREVATRAGDGERGATVLAIKRGVAEMKAWAKSREPAVLPRVLLVDQNGEGFRNVVARYHALESVRGGPIRTLEFPFHYSFGPAASIFMTSAPPEQIMALAETADVVWPIALDAYALGALAPILGRCPDGPFIVRAGGTWTCPRR